MKRLLSLTPLLAAVALPFATVQACGPDFYADVFVHKLHADHPAEFAAGRLGVLLPSYPRADLIVAYRYLDGGKLTANEQQGFHPTYSSDEKDNGVDGSDDSQGKTDASGQELAEPPGPADLWLKTRAQYAPPQAKLHSMREYNMVYSEGFLLAGYYENCQADGFRTATETLKSRAKSWGAKSAELADWIKGQDAVFSNCTDRAHADYYPANAPVLAATAPAAAPANAPALLRQDRDYQIAAAEFYAAHFEPARAAFKKVAQDTSSPWRGIARYLVARTLIREAFLTAANGADDTRANFNADLMKQAQRELESMRGEHLPGISSQAVEGMLDLVRLRTEPKARMREIADALIGPKEDLNFEQDLDDFTWYLNGSLDSLPIREDADRSAFKVESPPGEYRALTLAEKRPGYESAFHSVADLCSTSPLIDWLVTFQSPAEAARKHAFDEWKRTGKTQWLAAAMRNSTSSDKEADELIEGAGAVPPASPAWPTVTYHRLRLMIEGGQAAAARKEMAAAFPLVRALGSTSAENLFVALRMRTATSLDDALADAPRKVQERASEEQSALIECLDVMKDPTRKYDCKEDNGPVELSDDTATIFNTEMPLDELARAAASSALPQRLRGSVASVAWVRSVLLKNESIAAKMLPLLPEKLRQQAGPGVGLHPLMAILRNPGLRPYLDDGVQRSNSYDFVESYGDNWWCSEWGNRLGEQDVSDPPPSVQFLSEQAQQTGKKEVAALAALGSAEEYLGSQALEYARAHPSDPDVPEALYLTLRSIRYGCYHGWSGADRDKAASNRVAAIAREAGALMRKRYPANAWTRRATPYVWPVSAGG